MKRLIGLCLFWLGIGMALYWILPDNFFCICLMAACIAGGYYLFCGCQWIETWIMIDEGLLFYGGSFLHDAPGGALLWGNAVSYEKNSLLIKQGTGSEHVFMLFQQGLTSGRKYIRTFFLCRRSLLLWRTSHWNSTFCWIFYWNDSPYFRSERLSHRLHISPW